MGDNPAMLSYIASPLLVLLSLCAGVSSFTPPPSVSTKLTLAPAAPLTSQFYHNLTLASWGANAVEYNGTWHSLLGVYYTETQASPASSCGLGSWNYDSTVAYATSATATGPYEYVSMALPPCAQANEGEACGYNTNPELRRHPDGTWLLFTLGGPPLDNLTSLCDAPCSKGGPKPKIGKNATITRSCDLADQKCLMAQGCPVEQVQLHYAKHPAGPWSTLLGANERRDEGEIVRCKSPGPKDLCNTTSSIACCSDNPAPLVLANGMMVMLANGECKEDQTLPSAIDKAYERRRCFTEAPVLFLHTDPTTNVTRFKCIFHTFGEGANDGDGCNHGNWHDYTGGYAEAVTPGDGLDALLGEWAYNFSQPAYGGTVSFEDGKQIAYGKRERPKVALDESGVPVAVVNAVSGGGGQFPGWTFTLAQEILEFKA